MTISRLKTNRAVKAALTVVFLGAVLVLHPACGRRAPAVKNVIFFIGDGMSAQTEIAASRYLYGIDYGLSWNALPGKAYVATWEAVRQGDD